MEFKTDEILRKIDEKQHHIQRRASIDQREQFMLIQKKQSLQLQRSVSFSAAAGRRRSSGDCSDGQKMPKASNRRRRHRKEVKIPENIALLVFTFSQLSLFFL